jgi:Fe-S-cluster containining protein
MNEANAFECLQCATCCRNLLETKEGKSRGLTLTEKETGFFSPEFILPKLAVGLKEPQTIILYQLNIKSCPHISEKNLCQIYQSRPLVCQSFPIISGAISNRCKIFAHRKVGLSYYEPFTMKTQLEASEKLEKYIQNRIRKYYKKGIKLWEYDLTTKQWNYKIQYDTPP